MTLLLLDAATEPALHGVAKGTGTSLTLRRGARQHVLPP
jgi:hypothetical protein